VEYVKNNQEVLGGVFKDNKIYLTKIPYDLINWLNEKDRQKKRYLTCHCPMARESLNGRSSDIPSMWCNCSAGFARLKFNEIFNQEVNVEVIKTVIGGDDCCRFAIMVPTEYLK